MNDNTIRQVEEQRERTGEMETRFQGNIRMATIKVLDECKLTNQVEEIRESWKGYEIFLSGILNGKEREKLIECISKKTGKHKNLFQIIAFYN